MKKPIVSLLMTLIISCSIAVQGALPVMAADEELPVQTGNYLCWAHDIAQAELIAENVNGTLISFENGIVVLQLNLPQVYSAEESPAVYEFTDEQTEIKLYPDILYQLETDETEDENDETGESTQPETQLLQWHREYLQLDNVWEISTGKDVKVAVIDSGIDTDHPDLINNIILAYTTVPDSIYEEWRLPRENIGPEDHLGHGTHVAGIIGANSEDKSVMGVAPDCSIISIKALEKYGRSGYGYTSWIANAILKAAEQKADIINMSVGGGKVEDEFLLQAIELAVESGSIVVCAAGNHTGMGSREGIYYPARYDNTLAVTAAKQTEDGAEFDDSYSRYGTEADFIAPGTAIYSTIPDGYGNKNGTSMACPVVSGTAALVISVLEETEDADIVDILKNTALDMGEEGVDIYHGYGMIQPLAAVEQAESIKPTPTPETTPTPEPTPTPEITPEPTETPAATPQPTKKPAAEKPQPVVTPAPVHTPAPTPEEQQLQEKIDQLKDQLENLPPEEEKIYTTQEDTDDSVDETTTPAKKSYSSVIIGVCFMAGILLWFIILFRRRKDTE